METAAETLITPALALKFVHSTLSALVGLLGCVLRIYFLRFMLGVNTSVTLKPGPKTCADVE